MPLDLAAKCPQSAGLLARALSRRPESSWEMLIPILLELFQALLEQCFDDEAEFIDRTKALNWWNVLRVKFICRRGLRQAKVGTPRTRDGQAELLAGDVAETCAGASRAELGACYRELAA